MCERRRAPRFAFGGVAEITTIHPNTYIILSTAELSRFGCFVTTRKPMFIGTKVELKITHDGRVFKASGEVVSVQSENGMGIKFTTTAPNDAALLQVWLGQ
jgi:PilZ domain